MIEKVISLGAENVMVLSTCNRTEFYWSDVTPKKAMAEVYAELGMGVPRQEPFEFEGTTYLKDDEGNIYKNDLVNVQEVGKWDEEKECIVFNKEE